MELHENYAGEIEELYKDAVPLVYQAGKASTSYLQRHLQIGYAKAARILDLLEERGIVGMADGAKPREILPKQDDTIS